MVAQGSKSKRFEGNYVEEKVAHEMGMRSYPKLQGETGYAYERMHGVQKETFSQYARITGYLTTTARSTDADHPCRWIIIHEKKATRVHCKI